MLNTCLIFCPDSPGYVYVCMCVHVPDQEAGLRVSGALCGRAARPRPPLHLNLSEGPQGPQPAHQRVGSEGVV